MNHNCKSGKTCVLRIVVSCIVIINLAFTGIVFAQQVSPHHRGPHNVDGTRPHGKEGLFVSRLDRDGDGRVSREEFDGPPDHYDLLDKNGDGYLTENERPVHPPPGHTPPNFPPDKQSGPPQPYQQKPATDAPPPQVANIPPETGKRLLVTDKNLPGTGGDGIELSNQNVQISPEPLAQGETSPEIDQRMSRSFAASPWLWLLIISGVIILVLLLMWGVYSARRFRQIKEAVNAIDPHLLGVNIDDNIMITEVSEALCKATGFRYKDLIGKPLMALGSHIADNPDAMQSMWNNIKRGTAWKGEVKLVRKNGSVLWADAVISPSRRKKERLPGYTVIYQDVSKRKHFERLSMRDDLTGLFNRRYFNEVAPLFFQKVNREKIIVAMCILDVDYFKLFNDTYGHPAGDHVLAAIGNALNGIFQRKSDLVFRLGGEEFGALFIVKDPDDAIEAANKILSQIRGLQISHEKNPPGIVTVSIGMKIVKASESNDLKSIYERADAALYRAKDTGRDRFVVDSLLE